MKNLITIILSTLIGFYGMALITDKGDLLIFKSIVFFFGVLLAFILKVIDDIKN